MPSWEQEHQKQEFRELGTGTGIPSLVINVFSYDNFIADSFATSNLEPAGKFSLNVVLWVKTSLIGIIEHLANDHAMKERRLWIFKITLWVSLLITFVVASCPGYVF